MPAFDKDKIERMLKKMYPHLWQTITDADIDLHAADCAVVVKNINKKELKEMIQRFKRSFQ